MTILKKILRKLFYVDYKSPMWFDHYFGWLERLVEQLQNLIEE